MSKETTPKVATAASYIINKATRKDIDGLIKHIAATCGDESPYHKLLLEYKTNAEAAAASALGQAEKKGSVATALEKITKKKD